MENLFELQKILLEQFQRGKFYDRACFANIHFDNAVTGILGARGVGKTSFLLHTILQKNHDKLQALYVSADHVYFLSNTLLNLADQLYKETDVRWLCIDEIHKYPNWEQELKNIADFYADIKIIFTGSSMIDIVHSKFDLSRRVSLFQLHGFSFREYLEFTLSMPFAPVTLSDLLANPIRITQQYEIPHVLKHFKHYLQYGFFPFAQQFSQPVLLYQAIENSIQKTIYEDIATLHTLKTPSLILIEKLYKYILNSQPGELNANKLANALQKDFETISTYLLYLDQAGLIRSLYKKQMGKAFLKNPVKLYPDNPNYIYAGFLFESSDSLIGKVRETFAFSQLQNAGVAVYSSLPADFETPAGLFEIGGKNKDQRQVKSAVNGFVFADQILMGSKTKIPLYLLGFLS